jgi:hypothetical protein
MLVAKLPAANRAVCAEEHITGRPRRRAWAPSGFDFLVTPPKPQWAWIQAWDGDSADLLCCL